MSQTPKTVDITDQLKKFSIADEIEIPTKFRNPSEIKVKPTGEELLGDDDFDTDLIQSIGTDPIDDDQDDPKGHDDNDILDDLMSAEEFAEMITEVADVGITFGSTLAYRKTLVTAEQYERIQEILVDQSFEQVGIKKKWSPNELWHLSKAKQIEDYKRNEAPLTKTEGERLQKQLRRVLKGKNFTVSPAGGLGIAFGSIFLSRAMDCFVNLMDREFPPPEDPDDQSTQMHVEKKPGDEFGTAIQ